LSKTKKIASLAQLIASSIFKKFRSIRGAIESSNVHSKSGSNPTSRRLIKISACLQALDSGLKSTSSFGPSRRYAAAIAACACSDTSMLNGTSNQEADMSEALFKRLALLSDLDLMLKKACDCR